MLFTMNKIILQIGVWGWGRALTVLLVVWFFVMMLAIIPMFSHQPIETTTDDKLSERLAKAFLNLEILKKQNEELRNLYSDLNFGDFKGDQKELLEVIRGRLHHAERLVHNQPDFGYIEAKDEPNEQYEKLRRRISNNVQEFWYFVRAEILKIQKQQSAHSPDLQPALNHILTAGVEHKRALLIDLNSLAEVDGYENWRQKEARELSDLVQRRLHFLQNPPDCKTARKLICNLNKGCGYGCQLHHLVYCLLVAYGTERTLILNSKGWRYHRGGWDEVFLPLSDTCTDASAETSSGWPGKYDTQAVTLPIVDSLSPRPPYLPPAIPEDLAPRLMRLHGDPIVWWIGQFVKYVIRPQPITNKMIKESTAKLGFQKPIVGVHVRRTDKIGTEAAFHSIEEYMTVVDEYYNQLELFERVPQRRVFIATDDPRVILSARSKYPNYEVIGDPTVAKTAAVSTRYSDSSLNGIILDIHFLSMSDFIVCTFSSQVCRVAYEIMQTYYPDASSRFRSLDDIHYFGGGDSHVRTAFLSHEPRRSDEIELLPGDGIHIAGNHWNGYSKGKNLRTNQIGLYPSFKVDDKALIVKFPTYPYVPYVKDTSNVKNS